MQFLHRCAGYLLLIFGVVVWLRGRKSAHRTTRAAFNAVMVMVVAQLGLGIFTALTAAQAHVAISHQIGAIMSWVLIIRARQLAGYPVAGWSGRERREEQYGLCRTDGLSAPDRGPGQGGRTPGLDQETMMPRAAAEQRSEEMAAIEGVLHSRRTNPQIAQWLADAEAPDAAGAAQIHQIARSYDRSVKVPGDLAQEIARVTSTAQGIWAAARAADKVADFLPTLAQVIGLKRQEAACLAQGGDLYDALIDDFEPQATAASLGAMFNRIRPRLVALRESVLGAPVPAPLTGHFGEAAQLRLARDLATAFGYDWGRGRIDLAVHPFSSGGGDDSRITTRVVETDPFNCIYSTIHEVGHSSFTNWRSTPITP